MNHRVLLLSGTALLLLTSCMGTGPGPVDGKKYLSEMDGPAMPSVSNALVKSAKDADAAGDYKVAAQYYQQVYDKDPENKEAATSLADAWRKAGETDKAIAAYDAVLSRDANYALAKEGKALALINKGDAEGAERLLGELRAGSKGTWRTYNALGIILAGRQDPAGARTLFEEAVKRNTGTASAAPYNNLGLAYALNKEYDAAVANLAKASALVPAKTPMRKQVDLNTALVRASSGNLDEAERIARQYFEGAALQNNLGVFAHMANDDALARTYLNMALTESKTFYERAWKNLEAVSTVKRSDSTLPKTLTLMPKEKEPEKAPAPVELTKPAEAAPAKEAVKPVEEAKPKDVVLQPTPPALLQVPSTISPPEPLAAAPSPSVMPPAPLEPASAAPAYAPAATTAIAPSTPAEKLKPAKPVSERESENGFESLGNWVGGLLD